MSQNGTVKDCFAKLTDTIADEKLEELSHVLNENLSGTPLEQLHIALNRVIEKELTTFSNILGEISESIKYELNKESKKLSANVESILDLPEFSDIEKAKNFVNILSTKEIIDSTLSSITEDKLGIIIGSENQEMLLKDYTIVTLNIHKDEKNVGKISVIGPKRMDYSKTISTLKYINDRFQHLLLSDKKKNKEREE